MSKCSKKIKELKEKIDCVSGLDDDFVFMILCSIEKRINLIANYADEDELNGTCFNKNTQTADKMFEELRYKIIIDDEKQLQYEYENKDFPDEDIEIFFDKTFPSIETSYRNGRCHRITIQELQTISQKCKELGWI